MRSVIKLAEKPLTTSLFSVARTAQDALSELTSSMNLMQEELAILKLQNQADVVLIDIEESTDWSLGQNIPNPFSAKTSIPFSISGEFHHASIEIVRLGDLKVMESRSITESGTQMITFDNRDLSSGIYVYSLLIDGKVKATRKMIYQH